MIQEGNESIVKEQHNCSICLTVYFNPVQISICRHIFCEECLQGVQLQGNRRCPLCRTNYQPYQVNQLDELWSEIQIIYPSQVNQRRSHITNKKRIRLIIGNSTREIVNHESDNNYEWMFFIRAAEGQKSLFQLMDRVEVRLHHTFRPNLIVYTLAPITPRIQLKRIGWGTFRIEAKIFWKKLYEQPHSQVFHDLQFEPFNVQKQISCILHYKNK